MSATAQDGPQALPAASDRPVWRRFMRRFAPSRRGLRFASGIVLFVYLTIHLANHALGLVSLAVAEVGLDYAMLVWQSRIGTFLLYGAALVHVGLAFEAVYQRRTLRRMPFRDLLRIALGLNLPVLLIAHAASTRLAMEFYGYQLFYADVVRDLWQSSSQTRQFAILAPGWIHGCLGLQAALGRKRWWRAALPVLFGIFLVLPILSALGFIQMERELTRFGQVAPEGHGPSVHTMTGIALWRDRVVDIYLWLVAGLFAARIVRWGWERLRGATIEIAYPGARVRAPRGWTVLEASRANHIAHASACGGRARCSTCRVRVLDGLENCPPPGRNEAATLERIAAAPDMRLACQLRPTGPVSVAPLDSLAAASAQTAHEEVCALLFLDIADRAGLSAAMLPQDLQWALSEVYRVFDRAVRAGGGHVLMIGADHASACFPAGSAPSRAARKALAAFRDVETGLARLAETLEDHWKVGIETRMIVHFGPILIDPAILTAAEARAPVVVGRAIDEIDRARAAAVARGAHVAVSAPFLEKAGEEPEEWGEPQDIAGVSFRFLCKNVLEKRGR
ncbi:MAG TPA: 2Fe-2S iron-sulfur cluster-binding protein [Rhodoblastus sp.]|nr:2Fe-2S iron-sulfur cluster-binding protein [Rhodoblastus sp.]